MKMNKHYYESLLTRFFSWPKTKLYGNTFHVKIDNNLLYQPEKYYAEKQPKSGSLAVKIMAGILYPFFNPIAFIARKVGSMLSGYQQVLQDNKDADTQLSQKIRELDVNINASLKNFEEEEKVIMEKHDTLVDEIARASAGNNTLLGSQNFIDRFDEIFLRACCNFLHLTLIINNCIESENITVQERAAQRLSIQRPEDLGTKGFKNQNTDKEPPVLAFSLQQSAMRSLYIRARSKKGFILSDRNAYGDKEENAVLMDHSINNKSYKHSNSQEFYSKGTKPCQWRKMHNHCIKQFYKNPIFNRDIIRKWDERNAKATTLDKSKDPVFTETRIFG